MRVVTAALIAFGCGEPREPAAAPDAVVVDARPAAPVPSEPAPPKKRLKEPTVFVDGVPYAVIAWAELPPGVETRWKDLPEGRRGRRYSLVEYLEAVGVPLARARAVHLYGGRRVAAIEGPVFRRLREKLMFSFTMGTRGQPELRWPPGEKIPGEAAIDMLQAVAVYVEKEPPAKPVMEDGVPYQVGDVRGGVRVYLDGRLVGTIKRNLLGTDHLVPGSDVAGDPRWTLVPYLRSLGVPIEEVSAADLIRDGFVDKRLSFAELKDQEFSALPDQGGQIRLRPMDTNVGAMLLYARKKPPDTR